MATTQEDVKHGEDEFNAAFNEPEAERPEVNEDEAFGLSEPAEDAAPEGGSDQQPGENAVVTETPAEENPDAGLHGEQPAAEEPAAAETPAEQASEPGEETMSPEDIQRQKSWEGRLRAREAELKAREEALKGKEAGEGETPAQEANEGAAVETIEEVAAQVESGQITAEQAMKTLTEDFGEDFAKMLDVLIEAKAGSAATKLVDEKVGAVSKTVESVIADIVDDRTRTHFNTIYEAHPDFAEVAEGQAMKDYLQALPEAERAKAEAVIEKGSAGAIVKLLDKVKESAKKADEPAPQDDHNEAALSAAEGVRSTGLRLPEKPSNADSSYEDAWKDF